jgi:hypothetical protein
MAIMRSVVFTIIGIVAIGWVLATVAPPHWVFGELFLFAACILVIREYLLARAQGLHIGGSGNSTLAGGSAWFADSSLDNRDGQPQAFHPWDFERPAAKSRNAIVGHTTPAASPVSSDHQSVEQIAHEMLMQAFRQASRKHHPDHGGDPEEMRRVYAARDMILRAIHKP